MRTRINELKKIQAKYDQDIADIKAEMNANLTDVGKHERLWKNFEILVELRHIVRNAIFDSERLLEVREVQ